MCMTPRERVNMALNFKEPDRIPIDWGMSTVSGIHERAYRNLLDYLGMNEEIVISDAVQRLARPSEAILQKFHVDTRYIFCNPPSFWEYHEEEDGSWRDEFGKIPSQMPRLFRICVHIRCRTRKTRPGLKV